MSLMSILLLIPSLVLASCGNAGKQEVNTAPRTQNEGTVARDISVDAFEQKMLQLDDAQILDVRTPAEWEKGIIKGAVKINYYDGDFKQQLESLDKSKPVLVYCASGNRSGKAMRMMMDMGFTEIYNLDGGYIAWRQSGHQ